VCPTRGLALSWRPRGTIHGFAIRVSAALQCLEWTEGRKPQAWEVAVRPCGLWEDAWSKESRPAGYHERKVQSLCSREGLGLGQDPVFYILHRYPAHTCTHMHTRAHLHPHVHT
jgi:hypothetical protein